MTLAKQFIFFTKVSILLVCTEVLGDTETDTLIDPTIQHTAHSPSSSNGSSVIQPADCTDFINESPARVTCGFIVLPINHDTPSNQTVTLPVLIAGQTQTITNSPSNKAILIPGGGGPGASMGFGYQYIQGGYLKEFQSLRSAGFDIVIVDQRGAGYSKPTLGCFETSNSFKQTIGHKLTFEQELQAYTTAFNNCRERLQSEGIPLSDFNTYQSAKDFLVIMDTLAYPSWSTLATSYATVIAQAIEILQPQTFDRIVLDSPVPMDYQQTYTVESSKNAINKILLLCEITPQCNKKHPLIKTKFNTLLDQTSNTPYEVLIKVSDDITLPNSSVKLIINNLTLLDILVNAAYSNYTLAEIPVVIDQLHQGQEKYLVPLATDYWYNLSDLDYSEALGWVIHCKERTILEHNYLIQNPDYANDFSVETKLELEQERLICKSLNVSHDNKLKPTTKLTPSTLVVAGDLDPVISRQDIKNTTRSLSNATTQIIAGMSHSVWYQSECTRNNVVAFLATIDTNETPKLTTCTDGITRFK